MDPNNLTDPPRWQRVISSLAAGDPGEPSAGAIELSKWIAETEQRVIPNCVLTNTIRNVHNTFRPKPSNPKPLDWSVPTRLVLGVSAVLTSLPVVTYVARSIPESTNSEFSLATLLWLAYFAVVSWLGVAAALTTWRWFMDKASQILAAVDDSRDLGKIKETLDHSLNRGLQILVACSVSALAILALWMVSGDLMPSLPVVTESYVALGAAAFIGGSDMYWLVAMSLLTWKYGRLTSLRLEWIDPAETAGVRLLGARLGLSAVYGAAAIFGGVVPVYAALRFYVGDDPTTALYAALYAALITGTFLFVYWAAAPQISLSRSIRSRRKCVLDTLRAGLDSFEDSSTEQENTQILLETYALVRESRRFTMSKDTVVQYAVAGLTLAVPLLLPILSS